MDNISRIREQIKKDPENQEFQEKGWEPIFMANKQAKIVIIGSAPGIKTQEKEDVLRDKSGNELRNWLGVSEDEFYHSGNFAVLPLDFYFPGKAKVGDLPPRKGFADKWHPLLLNEMPDVQLTILMGLHAQKFYLKSHAKKTLTETVFAYEEYLPDYFPIVHPSPLNFRWHAKNPTFKEEIVPILNQLTQTILSRK